MPAMYFLRALETSEGSGIRKFNLASKGEPPTSSSSQSSRWHQLAGIKPEAVEEQVPMKNSSKLGLEDTGATGKRSSSTNPFLVKAMAERFSLTPWERRAAFSV